MSSAPEDAPAPEEPPAPEATAPEQPPAPAPTPPQPPIARHHVLAWAALLVPTWLLCCAAHAWTVHCSAEPSYDTAIALQHLRSTLHGWGWTGLLGTSPFGDHFNPLYLVALPLYLVWPSPLALQALKSAALLLTFPGLAQLARLRLGEGSGRFVALAAALSPMLWLGMFMDYHTDTLAVGALPWLLVAYERRRLGWTVVLALVVCASKEHMALVSGGLGVLALHERRAPRWWLTLGGLGAAFAGLGLLVVIPASSPEPDLVVHGSFYARLATLAGWGQALGDATLREWLLFLTLSCAGLFLLAPRLLWPAVPLLLAHGLSSWPNQRAINWHYLAPLVPLLAYPTLAGVARLAPHRRRLALVALLALNSIFLVRYGPFARLAAARPAWGLSRLLAELPPEEPVWCSFHSAVRVADRPCYLLESYATGYYFSTPLLFRPAAIPEIPTWGLICAADKPRARVLPRAMRPIDAAGDWVLLAPTGPSLVTPLPPDAAPAWIAVGACGLAPAEQGAYLLRRASDDEQPPTVALRLLDATGAERDRRPHVVGYGLAASGAWRVAYRAPLLQRPDAPDPTGWRLELSVDGGPWLLASRY